MMLLGKPIPEMRDIFSLMHYGSENRIYENIGHKLDQTLNAMFPRYVFGDRLGSVKDILRDNFTIGDYDNIARQIK